MLSDLESKCVKSTLIATGLFLSDRENDSSRKNVFVKLLSSLEAEHPVLSSSKKRRSSKSGQWDSEFVDMLKTFDGYTSPFSPSVSSSSSMAAVHSSSMMSPPRARRKEIMIEGDEWHDENLILVSLLAKYNYPVRIEAKNVSATAFEYILSSQIKSLIIGRRIMIKDEVKSVNAAMVSLSFDGYEEENPAFRNSMLRSCFCAQFIWFTDCKLKDVNLPNHYYATELRFENCTVPENSVLNLNKWPNLLKIRIMNSPNLKLHETLKNLKILSVLQVFQ